ncbi:cysteine protease [Dorcoceras hygrometricum]|uniref:Cysteine protease n=1 Tax=Dorcoceras hygrometricum TaxID=472368 RepID=A0A2Z7CJ95_9LAMI|nr:cysteine protease [Dorcoceras hygrometricum]
MYTQCLLNPSLRTGGKAAYTQGLLYPSRLMIIQVIQHATPLLAYKYPEGLRRDGSRRPLTSVCGRSRKLLFTSRCYLEIAIAKRCRLHKLIRQHFALALKIQQEDFALITSRKIQSRKIFSHSDKSAAKQLTTYEELSKLDVNCRAQFKWQNRQEACKRKGHKYCSPVVSHTVEAVVHLWSLGVLTAAGCGIGSVHAVVRSNLLVEPSEVEEGEM